MRISDGSLTIEWLSYLAYGHWVGVQNAPPEPPGFSIRIKPWCDHWCGAMKCSKSAPSLRGMIRCQLTEMMRGKLQQTLGSTLHPNSARPGYWRVEIVTSFGTFTLMPFCMAVWQSLYGRIMPKRGFGDTHGLSSPKAASIRVTDESPFGDQMAMGHCTSSWMRADINPMVAGAMQDGNTRGFFYLCNQTIVTPSIFGRQWIPIQNGWPTAQITFSSCFSTLADRLVAC